MSLGHSIHTSSVGGGLPWQYRSRPTLFVVVTSIVVVLLLVGTLISTRRLIGVVNTDMSLDVVLLLALGAAAALAFARIAWRRSFPLETPADLSFADQFVGWASSAALALLAVGCCYPGYRTAEWLIWLPILVADQMWRQNFFDAGEPWIPADEENIEVVPTVAFAERSTDTAVRPDNDEIVQQLYRIKDDQGQEVIYGTLRADFVAGQRTAAVYAGFCPPLAYLPEIEAEALPGSQAKIKIVQALSHGARLDVRLPATAPTDSQIWIDMAARPSSELTNVRSA